MTTRSEAAVRAPLGEEDLLSEHVWGSGTGPEFSGPRHEYRERLMIRRLRRAVTAGRILNAGAGAGSLTVSLLEAGFEVTSIDTSDAFVERLRALLEPYGTSNTGILNGDLTELPFADASFDGIVCGEVLEHIPEDALALSELRRVLRPGGVLVATVPANPWRYDWFDKWVGHQRRYTAAGLEERLLRSGFDSAEAVGWGFPITGLYHRLAYRPLMRRRLRASDRPSQSPSMPGRTVLLRAFRLALEIDSLFIGRRPGYFGLLATARCSSVPPTTAIREHGQADERQLDGREHEPHAG